MATMTRLFERAYTGLVVDQHFPVAPYITFERFDARAEMAAVAAAHVDSYHVVTKCHHGFYYYDTQVGRKHPALGARDQVHELLEAAHAAKLEAVAYTCIGFDNDSVVRHPEWSMVKADGTPRRLFNNNRWGMPCINSGYRDELKAHLSEVAGRYPFDGLFLDIFGQGFLWERSVCYCADCLAAYRRLGLDSQVTDRPARMQMMRYWQANWAALLSEIRAVVDAARPGIVISLNGGPFHVGGQSLSQLDFVYSEGGNQPANAVALGALGVPYPQCGIPAGNDAFDAWPEDIVRIMTSTVLAHGARTFFFFMQGRTGDGIFDAAKLDLVTRINRETRAKAPHLVGATPVTAVALYHSEASNIARMGDTGSADWEELARPAGGIINALRRLSMPCQLLPAWRLSAEELARFQLVILADAICLSDQEAALFRAYVESGGHLLVCGRTGLCEEQGRPRADFALADVMGLRYTGENRDYALPWGAISGFMRAADSTKHPLFRYLPERDLQMPGNEFLQTETTGADVLAWVAEPLARETPAQYIGWLALPPGGQARWPAVTTHRFGCGACVYTVARLADYAADPRLRWPARFVEGLLGYLQIDPGVSVEGPKGVLEATFWRQGSDLVVHLLNQSLRLTNGEMVPLRDITLTLDPRRHPVGSAQVCYPDPAPLELEEAGSRVRARVQQVDLHTIVRFSPGSPAQPMPFEGGPSHE
jgi:hypothetical protein